MTYINEREPAGIIVHDGQAGVFVHYGAVLRGIRDSICAPGDIVEVDGQTNGEGFAPDVVPTDIRRIGARRAAAAEAGPLRGADERRLRL